MSALPALKGREYDEEGYPALEARVLRDVGYATISRTHAPPLAPRAAN